MVIATFQLDRVRPSNARTPGRCNEIGAVRSRRGPKQVEEGVLPN